MRILVPLLENEAGGCPELPEWFRDIRNREGVVVSDVRDGCMVRERWDVIYLYWPEWSVRRPSLTGTVTASISFLAQLSWARSRGSKIVWQVNNIYAHEGDRLSVMDTYFKGVMALVDLVLAFTQTTLDDAIRAYPVLRMARQRVVGIGHYADFYPKTLQSRRDSRDHLNLPQEAKIALALGMVRPYKNTHVLLQAFREVADADPRAYLLIAGKCRDASLRASIQREVAKLPRARFSEGFVPSEQIPVYHAASDFSVLPTTLASTSGSALLALSLDRPVLVPYRSEFIEWAEWMGPEWVMTYSGGFRASVLGDAFAREAPRTQSGLRGHFDWDRSRAKLWDSLSELCTG